MGFLVIVVVASLAAIMLAGVYALWSGVHHVKRECVQRMEAAEHRMRKLGERLNRLEQEVTRQGVELEEQGIRFETKAYWDD